jgi:hypothetical protein
VTNADIVYHVYLLSVVGKLMSSCSCCCINGVDNCSGGAAMKYESITVVSLLSVPTGQGKMQVNDGFENKTILQSNNKDACTGLISLL